MTQDAGYSVFDADPDVLRWARAAHQVACQLAADPEVRAGNLRHGETWFVGVDALPNAADGSIAGVPLWGPWQEHIPIVPAWHPAQLSIVYPGYPGRDPDESDANHRFRKNRFAAHVDGLLPIGPERRRYLKEPHAFILGLPLNTCDAAPLMVWPGSHRFIGPFLADALRGDAPEETDITEAYQAVRRKVLESISPVPVSATPGQAILLHRHLLHGMGLWQEGASGPPEGRMIAYFRPQTRIAKWCLADLTGKQ